MESHMYYCPNCQKVYPISANETAEYCHVCNNTLHYMNMSEKTWNNLSDEEKLARYQKLSRLSPDEHPVVSDSDILQQINNSLLTIKNILIFFTVMFLISIAVTVFSALH